MAPSGRSDKSHLGIRQKLQEARADQLPHLHHHRAQHIFQQLIDV